ncbi:hypothetical protein ACGFR8_12820 [Streptomyces brevispora]|uniref:hypothetical protein n=1 Tax=Streptomyces brevispora TaxID=887462 RepID=UPI00371B55D0
MTDDPGSRLSRMADEAEVAQLAAGVDVLSCAWEVLDDPMSPHVEVRYAGIRLAECLRDVLRVAESRGLRLPARDIGDDEEGEGEGRVPGARNA